jgi:[ribosomal protein S18]-alanine N-acetyltransferase
MVRPFESADATDVARLTATAPEAAQWSEASYARLLAAGYDGWIATALDGTFVGFIITRVIATSISATSAAATRTVAAEAEILNLAVAVSFRRTGVAAELLQSALESFFLAHVRRIYLEVRASNAPAIGFYKKHGFITTGMRPDYYQYPPESAVLMEKILTVTES